MKILYSKSTLAGPISGADETVTRYALEMNKAGHQTGILLVHSPEIGNPLVTSLNAAGVPISILASPAFSTSLVLGRKAVLGLMRAISPASKIIRTISRKLVFNLLQSYHDTCCEYLLTHRPDIVHVVTPDPGAVMFIRAAHTVGIPVVYQEVGIPFHPPGFEEVYARLASVLPLCADVAALSPRLALEMNRVLPQLKRVQVLPLISQNGLNDGTAQISQSDDVCFGFAARLENLKGALSFVQAFALVRQFQPRMSIKIAGDGSQRVRIIATIEKFKMKKACQLIGVYKTAQERSRFMQSIDVFVLPSLTEGTPNVIIEAMAHGKPIIATDVGGIADIVTEEVGLLVPAEDTKALGAAMSELANNPEIRQKMGIAARKKYEQLFTPPAVLPVITEFYQMAISKDQLKIHRQKKEANRINHPWSLGLSTQTPEKYQ